MAFEVVGFEWDEGKRTHCQKHGLSLAEIEDVFRQAPRIAPALDIAPLSPVSSPWGGRVKGGRHSSFSQCAVDEYVR